MNNNKEKDCLENGWRSDAKIKRIIDGDTIEVEIRRQFDIRLRDIDVPEKKTAKGQLAREFVHQILKDKTVNIFIPSNQSYELMDINSFNRLVGDIYIDGELLQDILRRRGFEK